MGEGRGRPSSLQRAGIILMIAGVVASFVAYGFVAGEPLYPGQPEEWWEVWVAVVPLVLLGLGGAFFFVANRRDRG